MDDQILNQALSMRSELLEIRKKRSVMEAELQEIQITLDATAPGRQGSLTDGAGFPREDCDLYEVCTLRSRAVSLRRDLGTIMDGVRIKLISLHEFVKQHNLSEFLS